VKPISTTERAEKTRLQIERADEQLVGEFSTLPAEVVQREVEAVSEELLAAAHLTDQTKIGAVSGRRFGDAPSGAV
jgi:hypothetical protein